MSPLSNFINHLDKHYSFTARPRQFDFYCSAQKLSGLELLYKLTTKELQLEEVEVVKTTTEKTIWTPIGTFIAYHVATSPGEIADAVHRLPSQPNQAQAA